MNDEQARPNSGGVPAEQQQASSEQAPNGGSTPTSGGDGRIKIDLTAEYLMPDGKTLMTGEQVLRQMGRGALADDWQSKADQAAARLQQLGDIAAERDAAFEQLAAIKRREEMEQVIQERMPQTAPQQSDESLWGEESAPPATPMNAQQMAQLVTDLVERKMSEGGSQQLGDINSLIANNVREVMNAEQQNRAVLERDAQWAQNTRQERINHYVASGFDKDKATALVDKLSAAQVYETEGRMANVNGDKDAAYASFQNSVNLFDSAVEDAIKQTVAKQEADRLAELEQQLETGQFAGVPERETQGVDITPGGERWRDRAANMLARKTNVERAAARHDARNQARAALGNPPG
jgi:hypothetical protein